MQHKKIVFHLYHCKYSHGEHPGARVSDLYEICGQAEKSIMWNDNVLEIIQRMIERENSRQRSYGETRFEKGNLQTLNMLKKMVRAGYEKNLKSLLSNPGIDIRDHKFYETNYSCNRYLFKRYVWFTFDMLF